MDITQIKYDSSEPDINTGHVWWSTFAAPEQSYWFFQILTETEARDVPPTVFWRVEDTDDPSFAQEIIFLIVTGN